MLNILRNQGKSNYLEMTFYPRRMAEIIKTNDSTCLKGSGEREYLFSVRRNADGTPSMKFSVEGPQRAKNWYTTSSTYIILRPYASLNKNGPHELYTQMLSHQGLELFAKIRSWGLVRGKRKCAAVGRLWSFKSPCHAKSLCLGLQTRLQNSGAVLAHCMVRWFPLLKAQIYIKEEWEIL